MIDPKTLIDLNHAFAEGYPGGFVVTDSGQPRFVVVPFEIFQSLKKASAPPGHEQKILVTGGAGYIGSHTVRVLQDQGYEVVVLDNLSTGRREAVQNCKLVVADLADRDAVERIFAEEKIDAVMHFAGSVEVEESVRNPAKYFQNNVIAGLTLLDVMVEHNVLRLVFSSSAGVYGEPPVLPIGENSPARPTSPYGETKLIFENILKWYSQSYGLHSVSLRYFNAAGAWPEAGLGYNHNGRHTHLIPRVMDVASGRMPEIEIFGQDYETHDGTCVRDYIHVLDLAHAHVLALGKLVKSNGAYVYNVGTGKGYSVLEVIDAAVEVTGKMIPISSRARRAGDPARLVADSSQLFREFGWQPQHDLRSILESSWQWQRNKK